MSRATRHMLYHLSQCEPVGDCLRWYLACDPFGHGVVHVGRDVEGRKRLEKAHRVVYRMFGLVPLEPGQYVLHSCDNPWCVNIEHLRAGSAKDNMDDKYARGRENHPKGMSHPSAKLTEDIVRWLRSENPVITRDLAESLGVHRQVLFHAKWGKTWKHVK